MSKRREIILGLLLVAVAFVFAEGGCGGGSGGGDDGTDMSVYSGEYAGAYGGTSSGDWTMIVDDQGKLWMAGLGLSGVGAVRSSMDDDGGFQLSGEGVSASGSIDNEGVVTGSWTGAGGKSGSFSGNFITPTTPTYQDYVGAYEGDGGYTGDWTMVVTYLGAIFFSSDKQDPASGTMQNGGAFLVSDANGTAAGRVTSEGNVVGTWVLSDNSTSEMKGEAKFFVY